MTAALGFGGDILQQVLQDHKITESWNGTNWTEVNDLNTGRRAPGGNGIVTAALSAGGEILEVILQQKQKYGMELTGQK